MYLSYSCCVIIGSQCVLVLQLLCNNWQPVCTCLTVVVSSGLCPEIICVCTCVCKLCFVCMCGSVLLLNNYFINLFYLKKQPLGSGQGHGL